MSDRINLLRRATDLHKSPQFDSYSKVIIHIDDETDIEVGNDYGRTLEFENPFGSQEMATQLLARLSGFQYQPFSATGAHLDPAAEIGDGISIKDVYGGMYTRDRTFSRLMLADISAPHDEEINHEYKFETPTERKVKRQIGDVRATLSIQADQIVAEVEAREADSEEFRSALSLQAEEISAKVSQTGGNASSFGWSLTATGFYLYSGNTAVFSVDSNGASVQGSITATSGKIGGFTIGSNAIYNNISTFGGTQSTGVYVGTNGIQLGKNFKVDSSGNLTALTGKFTGNVNANKIQYGSNNGGYFSGNGLSSGTVGYSKTTSGVQGTLDQVGTNTSNINALYAYFNGGADFSSARIATLYLLMNGDYTSIGGRVIKDGNGNYVSVLTF